MRFTRTSARKAALSFAVVSALFEASASATTKTWFGFFTGEWGEPVNWSTFVTPNATDTAVFNPGDGSRDIYLNAAGTASILLVNGTASAAGPFTFTSHNGAFLTCGTVQINSSVNANTTGFTGLGLQAINLAVIDNSTLNLSAGTWTPRHRWVFP